MKETLGKEFLKELEAEAVATRKCLERVPDSLFTWKPHDKSMSLGTLSYIVADIPQWITFMVEKPEIDFATFPRVEIKTTVELVAHFDKNMKEARIALDNATDEVLGEMFYLKNQGQVLMSMPKKENLGSTINHLVHHRGQLTVFMRLKDLPVPSIYGPSADDQGF